jgi:ribosomal protein S12 methylthiotransferase
MTVQAEISTARLRAKVGRTLDVLVDSVEDGAALARSAADAPEIDGVVKIADAADLVAGRFARVRVTSADAHDLHAEFAA